MKFNADKCHLLVTSNYEASANINEFEIESSEKEKLLGTSIDTRLSFEHDITSLFKEVKRCKLKAFVISQFNYCPLIWMFYHRALNNRINRIHERALRLLYHNKNLSFSELLKHYTSEKPADSCDKNF